MKSKAQISVEFITLVSFMFLIFIIFFGLAVNKYRESLETRDQVLIDQLGTLIKSEINLAFELEEGYERNFTLPPTLEGISYSTTFAQGLNGTSLVVNYTSLGNPHESVFILPKDVVINSLEYENIIIRNSTHVVIN